MPSEKMNTCGTCKHWRKIRDEDHVIDDEETWYGPHGECLAIEDIPLEPVDAWLHGTAFLVDEKGIPVKKIDSVDSSLITKPEFGCTLHAPA